MAQETAFPTKQSGDCTMCDKPSDNLRRIGDTKMFECLDCKHKAEKQEAYFRELALRNSINLPDCYWKIISEMANLEGKDVGEFVAERLKQIIIEDAVLDTEYFGEQVAQGWKETLKDDKYYQETATRR